MLIDEAAYVFKNALVKDIFSECRKFSCGLFAATQLIEQMSAEVKAGVYGATAIRFASSVSDGDATALAKEMYCDRDFIRSMKSVDNSHAEWAVQVEGLTNKQAIRLTLPFGIVERAAKMSAADLENVLDLNHVRLTAAAPLPTRFHDGGHLPGGTPKSNSPHSAWNSDDGDSEEL